MIKKFENWLHREHSVIWCKIKYIEALFKNGFKQKTILFYPEKPKQYHILYILCHMLGYRITNDPDEKFDLAIAFQDITVRPRNEILEKINKNHSVVNMQCADISKERVDKIFEDVFGYGITIDPRTYKGPYVRKSDINAKKDAIIFNTPSEPEKGYVYQKLINSMKDEKTVLDMRAVIFKNIIPVAMVRLRSIPDRFIDDTVNADLADLNELFSKEEVENILRFSREFGLDYGELDILRDEDDKRIYIVDVNITPGGPVPGIHMSADKYETLLNRSAKAFVEVFMP